MQLALTPAASTGAMFLELSPFDAVRCVVTCGIRSSVDRWSSGRLAGPRSSAVPGGLFADIFFHHLSPSEVFRILEAKIAFGADVSVAMRQSIPAAPG